MGHGQHDLHAPGATHEPVVHDPENDIDARSATIWVIAGTVVLFLSLWVMVPIFVRVQEAERETKIYKAENKELGEVRALENKFLHDGPVKIEDVVKKLAGK
jgi:hypothetical protein